MADQDRDGVAAEVIYPTVGMLLCNHHGLTTTKRPVSTLTICGSPNYCSAASRSPDRHRADRDALGRRGHRRPAQDEGAGPQGRHDAGQSAGRGLRQPDLRSVLRGRDRPRDAAQLSHPDQHRTMRLAAAAGPSSTASCRSSAATRTSSGRSSSAACSSAIRSSRWCASRPTPAGCRITCTAWTTPTTAIATG